MQIPEIPVQRNFDTQRKFVSAMCHAQSRICHAHKTTLTQTDSLLRVQTPQTCDAHQFHARKKMLTV